MRITCFAAHTPDRPIAELELRHRLRARTEDRIRAARATGLRHLPLPHSRRNLTPQPKVWLEIDQSVPDLLAWMPMPALARTMLDRIDAATTRVKGLTAGDRPPS